MKQIFTFSLTILMIFGGGMTKTVIGQSSYKGLPLIKAESIIADYRIGEDWVRASWGISPQVASDTLPINCYSKSQTFGFFTDMDSILFDLKPGQVHPFYVQMNDTAYALTVIKGILPEVLQHESDSKNSNLKFWYEQNENNEYLDLLRSKYPFESLVKGTKSDLEKTQIIMNWVHNQWDHNGRNQPENIDAISILEEVKEGKNFRCVEYGIVATACLNAVGLKARTLDLKTKDVETSEYGAGHVLLEVYLNDLNKWILLDPQWDAMPFLSGVPLNAVELQKAISENYNEVEIRTSVDISKRHYIDWIYPYLYYFDISFDNREGTEISLNEVNGKRRLMLVPVGEKNPTVFEINSAIDDCIYTNSLSDFYGEPK